MAHNNVRNDWQLIADLRFENYEEFNEAVYSRDFNFHQLTSGRSKTDYRRFFGELPSETVKKHM